MLFCFKAEYAVIQWDTKILMDLTGKDKVDRIPVILSQRSGSQLLGIPKMSSGTGAASANAVFDLAVYWNVVNKVVAMIFDTTAANTGEYNGACVLLEQKIGRSLLPLACRHHIFEIIVGSIVTFLLGPTNGPTLPIFVRFKKNWKSIDRTKFEPGINDEIMKNALDDIQDDIIIFCQNEIKKEIARHDYEELLQLVLIFLGGHTTKMTFREPTTIHQARWMANLIYSLKMFMFKSQFKMSSKEVQALRRIIVYTIRYHVKAWFLCTYAVTAPNHDLNLMKSLYEYRKIDREMSELAVKKFCNHLWYLSDECIALAIFDPEVPVGEKRKMAQQILNYDTETDDETPPNAKRYKLMPSQVSNFCKMSLHDFITPNTLAFFDRFDISKAFLSTDPLN